MSIKEKTDKSKTEYAKSRSGLGFKGEKLVKAKLEYLGHKVLHVRYHYDLLVDNKYRIEVKTAKCSPTPKGIKRWNVGIYSKKENSDFFIFVLMPLLSEEPIFIMNKTDIVLNENRKSQYSLVFREDKMSLKSNLIFSK